jgi:hypothetical protein
MQVKQFKILKGERWFYIEIQPIFGESYKISSFTTENCAREYIRINGIQMVSQPKVL